MATPHHPKRAECRCDPHVFSPACCNARPATTRKPGCVTIHNQLQKSPPARCTLKCSTRPPPRRSLPPLPQTQSTPSVP
eukprot:3111082-Prymnesium_polylepis.1